MKFHWFADPLNKNNAPGMTDFTQAEIPSLESEFPEAKSWLKNHFLANVLRGRYPEEFRIIVLGFLRRTHHAFELYHSARARTAEYLDNLDTTNPPIGVFYEVLNTWEAFVLQAAMAMDLMRGFSQDGRKVFNRNDSSPEQRVHDIANTIKHVRSSVESGCTTQDHTVPVWLTNTGLRSFALEVTYAECAELLGNLSGVANAVQDARSLHLYSEKNESPPAADRSVKYDC